MYSPFHVWGVNSAGNVQIEREVLDSHELQDAVTEFNALPEVTEVKWEPID